MLESSRNYPPPPWSVEKLCLPRNQSLVPKNAGDLWALRHCYSTGCNFAAAFWLLQGLEGKGRELPSMECTTLCQPLQKRGMFSSILRVAQLVKNPPAMPRDLGSISGLGRPPGEGNSNPLQYSCLENPSQRSLAGYSPWGCKELDRTERLSARTHTHTYSMTSALIL